MDVGNQFCIPSSSMESENASHGVALPDYMFLEKSVLSIFSVI